jgi:hypothetical protein
MVPQLDKVDTEVIRCLTFDLQSHIMPRHAWDQVAIYNVLAPEFIDMVEISESSVVVVDTVEGMWTLDIGKFVCLVIHATEAQVQPTHERNGLVDAHKLLVMAPEERATDGTSMWVANDHYIRVSLLQGHFRVH